MTQVKQGCHTFTSPESHPLLSSQSFLLSSTNTLGQNANRVNFPASHSSHCTAPLNRMPSQMCRWQQENPSWQWELWREHPLPAGSGQPLGSAHTTVPQELLTPLCLFTKEREKPQPQAWLWPSPSLQLWHAALALALGCIPHCL